MGLTRENKAEIKEIVRVTVAEVMNSYIEKITEKVMEMFEERNGGSNANIIQQLKEYEDKVDQLQQEMKSRNLIINGIPETQNEIVNEKIISICHSLNIDLDEGHISKCYRFGKKIENKQRPILIKFHYEKHRDNILSKRKLFYSSKIGIKEDLTKKRYNIFKDAVRQFGFKNVWSSNGRIKIKSNERTYLVTTWTHYEELKKMKEHDSNDGNVQKLGKV